MKITELKIGECTFVPETERYSIRLTKDCWYSSKNQDTIMIMELLMNKGKY